MADMLVLNEDGTLGLNDDGTLKYYDSSVYPDGPPADCCCEEGCCPSAPENLTANITISCDCVTNVSVPLTYQAAESALAGQDIWRGSTTVSCTGPGGSTFNVKFVLDQSIEGATCATIFFNCGSADDEGATSQGAITLVCNPFFAEGSATGPGLGSTFSCCEDNDAESFIEWTVTA